MALSIGELVGYIRLDDTGIDQGAAAAEARVRRAIQEMGGAADGLDGRLGEAGRRAGEALGDGIADGAGDGAARAGEQVEQQSGGWRAAAAAAGAAGGAALGAGFATAAASAMDIADAQAKLDVQLGGTGPMSEKAGQVAGALYSSAYGESFGEVGEVVRMVMQQVEGMSTASAEDLQAVSGQVMSLAGAFDQDLGATVNAVGQMIKTGLADNATEALDILTVGFQNGVDKAGDLLDTFNEYGTQFRKVGLDGQQAMTLLQQGLDGGARDADIAADAIKEFSIRSVDGSKEAAESFAALGLNAEEMIGIFSRGGPEAAAAFDTVLDRLRNTEGQTDAATIAFGLFGTQSEDLGRALYNMDLTGTAAEMGDVAGAAGRLDATLGDTATAKVEALRRGYEMWSASLVATEGPLGMVAAGAAAFGPAAISMAGSLAMVAMAAGPVIASSARMVAAGAVWVAQTAIQGAAAVASTTATMASLVVQWVIMAARAVAQAAIAATAWVIGFVAPAAGAIASMVATAAVMVAQWVVMAAGAMARAAIMAAAWVVAMGPIGWIIAAVVGLVALIIANWDTVVAWTQQAWAAVSAAVTVAWDWIKNAVQVALDFIIGLVTGFIDLVTAPWRAMWALLQGDTEGAWQIINDATGGALDWLMGILGGAWDWVTSTTQAVWDGIVGFLSGIWDTITSTISTAANSVVSWLSDAWNNVLNTGRAAWDGIVNAVRTAIGNVLNAAAALPGQIMSAVGNLGGLLVEAGRNVVQGLWNGIVSLGGWLYNQIMGWIRSVVPGPVLQFLGIASPSKWMKTEVGRWIPEGLAEGIIGNAKVAADSARQMAAETAAGAQAGAQQAMASFSLDLPGIGSISGTVGVRGGDGASADQLGRQVDRSIHMTINNPLPESSSTSISRRTQVLAVLGRDALDG